jgi:hypothetical protein
MPCGNNSPSDGQVCRFKRHATGSGRSAGVRHTVEGAVREVWEVDDEFVRLFVYFIMKVAHGSLFNGELSRDNSLTVNRFGHPLSDAILTNPSQSCNDGRGDVLGNPFSREKIHLPRGVRGG